MKLYKREKYLKKIRGFYHETDIIKVITGIRRCGKSSIMQLIIEELIDAGINNENIIYINLDKRGYKNVKTNDELETLIDKETKNIKGIKYLFIDEVQNVKGFEVIINAFREENDFSIFITGSNSYLLSGELITKLTGRYLEFELFPLTFDEYIDIKKYYSLELKSDIEELNDYIINGGFPRSIFFNNILDKKNYVIGLIDEIFKKDIKRRIIIRKKETFEVIKNYIINNFGSVISLNNIFKGLKQSGLEVGKSTLSKYIQVLLDAKILYECDRFDLKSKRYLFGEKKYYLSDLSFYYALNTDNRINYGPSLENIVFLYAKSKGYSISVGQIGKLECDFILRNKLNNDYSYVQIAYTILNSKDTEDREYRSLENIKDNYPKYVLTTDFLLQKRNGIIHYNLMNFIKENKDF